MTHASSVSAAEEPQVCRRATLVLTPEPTAVRTARHWLADRCAEWGLTELTDTVALLVSELSTNVVLHARTAMTVTAEVRNAQLSVTVADEEPRPPVPREQRADLLADIDTLLARGHPTPADVDDRHALLHVGPAGPIGAGRGLQLVEALSDEWGVSELAEGKAVWFRLAVPADSAYRFRCTCGERAAVRSVPATDT